MHMEDEESHKDVQQSEEEEDDGMMETLMMHEQSWPSFILNSTKLCQVSNY